jgi:hypothetical protein
LRAENRKIRGKSALNAPFLALESALVNKELRPWHEEIVCDVCGRTMLKGERAEPYLAPGGQRMLVCELCSDRASAEGWIRESAHDELPTALRRHEPRRSILSRLRRRAEPAAPPADGGSPPGADGDAPEWAGDGAQPGHDAEPAHEPEPPDRQFTRPKEPRHVRAIPTNAQMKVERAVDVFNGSEHTRTVAGISRSLGEPWVNVTPSGEVPSEVAIIVAWELSWYHYRVDLGDEADPVEMLGKGEEIDEIDESFRHWNAALDDHGRVVAGDPATGG